MIKSAKLKGLNVSGKYGEFLVCDLQHVNQSLKEALERVFEEINKLELKNFFQTYDKFCEKSKVKQILIKEFEVEEE